MEIRPMFSMTRAVYFEILQTGNHADKGDTMSKAREGFDAAIRAWNDGMSIAIWASTPRMSHCTAIRKHGWARSTFADSTRASSPHSRTCPSRSMWWSRMVLSPDVVSPCTERTREDGGYRLDWSAYRTAGIDNHALRGRRRYRAVFGGGLWLSVRATHRRVALPTHAFQRGSSLRLGVVQFAGLRSGRSASLSRSAA